MNDNRRANYGFSEFIANGFSFIYTKIFWPKARLVRYPIRVRGKAAMQYGNGFTTGYNCRLEMNGKLDGEIRLLIGDNCVIGDYAHIAANFRISVGNNVLMASRVFITDSNHLESSKFNPNLTK